MPPVLTERTVWRRPRPATEPRYSSDLTPEEQAHVRASLRVLRVRFGGWAKLAEAMRAKRKTVEKAGASKGKPSAGLALRAARLVGVAVEDILIGAWPIPGSCPMCGRCDEPTRALPPVASPAPTA